MLNKFTCTIFFVIYRTGSKLGISPLMLAAMNGHTSAVKLLLDTGADINAQVHSIDKYSWIIYMYFI